MAIAPNAAGGNWSAGATWVGGVAPTAADDVVYDTLTGTLTIDGTAGSPNFCRSFTATACVGTLSHGAAKQVNVGDGTTGHWTIVSGLTYAPAATSIVKFVSTTTGNQITSAAKRVGSYTFDGVGGAWAYQDAQDHVASATTTLTNGSLDTNGQAVGATSGTAFSSSNSNTRTLTLGATAWKLGVADDWNIATSTGMTLSAASSTVTSVATTGSPTFAGGGLTYGTFSCTTHTTGRYIITGANTFGTLTLSRSTGTKSTISGYRLAANQTVTGTFTSNGNSAILRNFIYSDTAGTQRTITAATVVATHTDFCDIIGAGAGSWDFSALTTTANGNAGNTTGITFTTAKNCYLKVNANASWSASNWFTTSGGSTNIVPAVPLIHDTAIIDANASFSASRTITNNDQPRLPSFNWTGAPNTPVFAMGNNTWQPCGSFILISGMSVTGTGTVELSGRGSHSYDGGTLTPPSGQYRTCTCGTGTYILARNTHTGDAGFDVTSGTLDMNGFTLTGTTSGFGLSGGTLKLTGTASYPVLTWTVTGTIDVTPYQKATRTATTWGPSGSAATSIVASRIFTGY